MRPGGPNSRAGTQPATHGGRVSWTAPRATVSFAICQAPGAPMLMVTKSTGPAGAPVEVMPLTPSPRRFSAVIAVVRSVGPSWARTCGASELDRDEDDERHRHRRHRAPHNGPGGDAQGEGEGGVADRHDPARGEERRRDPRDLPRNRAVALPAAMRVVDRAGPPGHQQV